MIASLPVAPLERPHRLPPWVAEERERIGATWPPDISEEPDWDVLASRPASL